MAVKKKTDPGKSAAEKKGPAKKTVKKSEVEKKTAAKKVAAKKPAEIVAKKIEEVKSQVLPVIPPPPPPPQEPQRKKIILDTHEIMVKDLADKLGVRVGEVIKVLMQKGVMATINQRIDLSATKAVASSFDVDIEVKGKKEQEEAPKAKTVAEAKNLVTRDPVVTILGHVDHGKTKLLDTIRNTHVMDNEFGGITQHIGAYQVEVKGRKITFLDTPGHEAFTSLRARGAKVTDIAVLVVAADDGVMPQTIEAIDHAKAAGVPIVVALNKIDKPEANLDRVKKQLSELGLTPEDWGGNTVTVAVSAKEAKGIDELLEMIILVADMLELRAQKDGLATGVVVESKLDKTKGPIATVLIKSGTLHIGDPYSIGPIYGKVRAIINDKGVQLKSAGPSMPVEILGAQEVPQPGDFLLVTKTDKEAKLLAEQRAEIQKKVFVGRKLSLEEFSKHVKEGERKDLNLIVKADVQGSLEALVKSLLQIEVAGIHVKVIHGGTGNMTKSDVILAEASQAIIIGFNVDIDAEAKQIAELEGVDVRTYNIIYNMIDDIRTAMEGMLEPEYEEVSLGNAEVRNTFKYSKVGTIAGCFVIVGKLLRGSQMRIMRETKLIYQGKLESLKRFKDDVREVEKGYECGVAIVGYNDFKVGDMIESYEVRVKPRKKAAA